jgi:hypothetical protein
LFNFVVFHSSGREEYISLSVGSEKLDQKEQELRETVTGIEKILSQIKKTGSTRC